MNVPRSPVPRRRAVVIGKTWGLDEGHGTLERVSWLGNQRLPRRVHLFKFPEGDPFFTSRYVTKQATKTITGGDRTQCPSSSCTVRMS